MQGTLLLAILRIKSSYVQEIEESLDSPDDTPDTLQWWIAADTAWRIRTFSLDHDIHTHAVAKGGRDVLELAQANNSRHYGDIVDTQHILIFEDCTNTDEVQKAFRKIELPPRLEIAEGRFAFWKPDEGEYRTRSQPKQ